MIIYGVLSATYLLNLMMVFPYKGRMMPYAFFQSLIDSLVGNSSYITVAYLIAFGNVVAFLYLTFESFRLGKMSGLKRGWFE